MNKSEGNSDAKRTRAGTLPRFGDPFSTRASSASAYTWPRRDIFSTRVTTTFLSPGFSVSISVLARLQEELSRTVLSTSTQSLARHETSASCHNGTTLHTYAFKLMGSNSTEQVLTDGQVQTPQQRRANERFAKKEEAKMGSFRPPKADKDTRKKTDISKQFRGSQTSKWIICASAFLQGAVAVL